MNGKCIWVVDVCLTNSQLLWVITHTTSPGTLDQTRASTAALILSDDGEREEEFSFSLHLFPFSVLRHCRFICKFSRVGVQIVEGKKKKQQQLTSPVEEVFPPWLVRVCDFILPSSCKAEDRSETQPGSAEADAVCGPPVSGKTSFTADCDHTKGVWFIP